MAVINKIKKGADEYDIQDPNAATKTGLQALETTVSGKQNALTETQLAAVNSGIDSTKVGQIATNASDIDTIEGKIPSAATAQNQLADKTYVDTADNGLQSQIDAISASSDVKDIVGTKAELDNYDTSTLGDNDIIKVLQDESENDATTYYRWSTSTNSFTLIGEEGPYYTKSQANALLDNKVDKVTGKGLSENDFTTTLKDKLDGIEVGAEVNDINSISVNGTAVTPDANKNVALTIPDGIKTLTTADYNYPANNPTSVAIWKLPTGIYKKPADVAARMTDNEGNYEFLYLVDKLISGGQVNIIKIGIGFAYSYRFDESGNSINPAGVSLATNAILLAGHTVNNLVSTADARPLSAAQGKYLNDNKADKTAFTGTDGTAAGTMGLVPAPATTDAGKFLKADGTWDTAGSPINVVQTTGTSTTDVMSQNAVTGMVFADPSSSQKIRIGNTETTGSRAICVGTGTASASKTGNIAIGYSCRCISGSYNVAIGGQASISNSTVSNAVALGYGAQASKQGEFNIGVPLYPDSGYNGSAYRLLTGLYDPQSAHDAVTKGYVDNAVINGGTTQPTTSTVGTVGTQYNCVNSGTPEIYICTDTTGGTYTWTKIN